MQRDPGRGIEISEAQAPEHLKEKHLQMVMDAQQAGRPVKAVPVSVSAVGYDLARTAVEASDRTMKRANRKSFLVPELPWLKKRAKQ